MSGLEPQNVETSKSQPRLTTLIQGALIVFLFTCLAFGLDIALIRHAPAWHTFEFCQYAEIGKNLALEGSFTTRVVEPMALAFLDANKAGLPGPRWPVINRYPLPCLVVAGLMRLFGPTDTAAAWSNGLALALLAAFTWTAARLWYGPLWAAAFALLFVASPGVTGYFPLLGTPDLWFATLFFPTLLAWYHLYSRSSAEPRHDLAIAFGLLAGLSYLTRFNVVLFLAPQFALLLAKKRFRETALALAAFLLTVSPLLAYNLYHFGAPTVGIYSAWNLLDGIGAFSVEPWLYYQVPSLTSTLRDHLSGFLAKWASNLFVVVPTRAWTLWHFELLLPLAILAAGSSLFRRKSLSFALSFLSTCASFFLLQLVAFSALRLELEPGHTPHHGRYFFWFAPMAVLLAIGLLHRLTLAYPRARWFALVLVLAQLALYVPTWRQDIDRNRAPTNLGHDPIRGMLVQAVSPGSFVASNQPQFLSWYCGRAAVSLPADPIELDRLNQHSKTPVDYIFIDLNANWIDLDGRWAILAMLPSRVPSPWEQPLLERYVPVLPLDRTRPMRYVLLRRKGVQPSRFEREFVP